MTRWITAATLLAALAWSGPAAANCNDDVPEADEDCDEDGWSKGQGDCDDVNEIVNPGKVEQCDDFADNDCNGFFDDGCESATQRGTLVGGGACEAGSSAFLLLPLLGFARRRSARC